MKTIEIMFTIGGTCSLILDVPSDYQIPSTDPIEFWKDIQEKFGDQIEVDPYTLNGVNWELPPESKFIIDDLGLDEFLWANVFGDDDEYESSLDLSSLQ